MTETGNGSTGFYDNAESIAVVVGNRDYKQTVSVDFALNDADAMQSYLTGALGFRKENIFLLKDATLSELNQMFGTDSHPESGRLWRSVVPGKSNVFVYYSGHGVPDLATREPFLLPQDGNPNQSDSGYALQTLYRNLDLVKQKIGADRQLFVMIDACFTGETGRKGESLLAVSAPGFTPAKPKVSGDIIRLVATSGDTPANWDMDNKLGLFTSRFLMGAAGLARPSGAPSDKPITWSDLQTYLKTSVEATARRETGRDQTPEIDATTILLKPSAPVAAVAHGVALAKDEASWQAASGSGTKSALETYVAQCGATCLYKDKALAMLQQQAQTAEGAADEKRWQALSRQGKYKDYLDGCTAVCAYRSVAETYLGATAPTPKPASGRQGRDGRGQTYDVRVTGAIPDAKLPATADMKLAGFDVAAYVERACKDAWREDRCDVYAQAEPTGTLRGYLIFDSVSGDGFSFHTDPLAANGKACYLGGPVEGYGGPIGSGDFRARSPFNVGGALGMIYLTRVGARLQVEQERWNPCFKDHRIDDVYTLIGSLTRQIDKKTWPTSTP